MSRQDEDVIVRRQPTGSEGRVRFDAIRDLRWDYVSGGVKAKLADYYLHCNVYCDQVDGKYFGHSGVHGPCPHDIKVCITKTGNSRDVYDLLAKRAGSKPPSRIRCPFSKEEKASRLYLMWGKPMPSLQGLNIVASPILAEEYYKEDLIANFIKRCKERSLNWAILSPCHGVWKSTDKNLPNEKTLAQATANEKNALISQIQTCSTAYQTILLYSGRLYDRSEIR